MKNIIVIDYGIGNVKSIINAFNKIGNDVTLSCDSETIINADYVVLPGVGSFKGGMERLILKGLDKVIHKYVETGKPLLGICLGMQMFFENSSEFGDTKGLGLIEGSVDQLPNPENIKLPNIAWSKLHSDELSKLENGLFSKTTINDYFYFVHTFAATPKNKEHILAFSEYSGSKFCAAVKKDNVYGTQFHPEKSGEKGLQILKEFINL